MCKRCSSESDARSEAPSREKKEYKVTWAFSGWCRTYVTAFDEDEARELAGEMGFDTSTDRCEYTDSWIDSVELEESEDEDNGNATN